MRKFVSFGAFALLMAATAVNLTACGDDENLNNVTPPVVETVTYHVGGVITAINGNPISGATVTLTSGSKVLSATTDASGVYALDGVDAGEYTVSASASGKIEKTGQLSVTKGSYSFVWNAALASEEAVAEVTLSNDGSAQGDAQAEALADNQLAEVVVEAEVPAQCIEIDGAVVGDDAQVSTPVVISLTPVYGDDDAETRAAQDRLITGMKLSCNYSQAKIAEGKSIDLTFNVDESTAENVVVKRYVDGQWTEVTDATRQEGTVVVPATDFGVCALFCPISFSMTSSSKTLSWAQSVWDNLYGANAVSVTSATYTYQVGVDFTVKAKNVFEALLLEALAREYGATSSSATGTYPVNVSLPIGTKLELSGWQTVNTVTAASSRSSISATRYGEVMVQAQTSNRSHTGSSSGGI